MNTKLLLGASAVVMGVAGVAASFLPHEILAMFGSGSGGMHPVFIQLLGALLFAFAMANWAAKGSLIGGIYNRPLALGNLTHFVMGALALGKATMQTSSPAMIAATAAYAIFAVAFAMVFFRSPVGT